jgi:hypothetical protein
MRREFLSCDGWRCLGSSLAPEWCHPGDSLGPGESLERKGGHQSFLVEAETAKGTTSLELSCTAQG